MAEPTRYAALAARLLAQRPPATESRTSRDVGVSVVAHAMTLRRRRRALRNMVATGALAAAAIVAVWFGVTHRSADGVATACAGASCRDIGAHTPALPEHGLVPGESLVAPPGQTSSVVLATGTRITLGKSGALECREDGATQRFAVLRGEAHLSVAKLRAGQRFLIETPSAELEVRGTAFSVRVDAATSTCATRTSVEVDEGAVEVRSGGGRLLLHPGERWASACSEVEAPAQASPAPAASTAPHAKPTRVAEPETPPVSAPRTAGGPSADTPAPAASASPPPLSSLTQQNDLYARGESASRDGRRDEALAAYARLLALFPSGPLAESASAKRVRLLSQRDRSAAREEAKHYLARYPSGFARAEMEALTTAP